ncbi:MAG: hypothetical protein IRZ02_02265 [Acidothermus sp.]|nr:hypothetical protein [Acidothermus sp.]MCL6537305.1 hypothetical protein [Acidothermus sp.]
MSATLLDTPEARTRFIRYTRVDAWSLLRRFPVQAEAQHTLLAEIVGVTLPSVQALVAAMERSVQDVARQLASEPPYRDAVAALPLAAGDRLVALGDSITADRLGWFEILGALVRIVREEEVLTSNLAVSGGTTTDLLERLDLLGEEKPTWVLVMAGTNDVRCHAGRAEYRMVSLRETERNLHSLRRFVVDELGARLTFLTPPPIDQARVDSFAHDAKVSWRASDVADIAALIRRIAPDSLDVHTAFSSGYSPRADDGEARLAELLDADGVHLTPAGQIAVAKLVLGYLSGTT